METISILVATYNNPGFLANNLLSLLRQQTHPEEVLVAEDSPACTESEKVAEKFRQRGLNVRYFRHAVNKGRTVNYRFLLEQATSEYVLFLDGDDQLCDDSFLRDAKTTLKEIDCVLYSAGCVKHYKDRDILSFVTNEDSLMDGYVYFKRWISAKQTLPHSSTLFKRNVALKSDCYRTDALNTDIISLRNLLLEGNLFLSKEVVSQWNYHEFNASCHIDLDEMACNLQTVTIPFCKALSVKGRSLSLYSWYFKARTKYVLSMVHLLYPHGISMLKFLRKVF